VSTTTHGDNIHYDVRGSTLADLMMSVRRSVATATV